MFAPYAKELIPTRPRPEDPDDVRMGAFVTAYDGALPKLHDRLGKDTCVVLGYPDDRGVDRNFGRIGASEGPDEIRKILYAQTLSPLSNKQPKVYDLGNFLSWSHDLLEAQEMARGVVNDLRKTGTRLVTLGGGHDWAYPDYADFAGHIINVDAHLDMRPLPTEKSKAGHSGTPFRRILTSSRDLHRLSVLGLQQHCNAKAHLEFANGFRVTTLFLEEMPAGFDKQWTLIEDKLELKTGTQEVALSVDLDAFSQSIAPGVSAPQLLGIDPRVILRLIRSLGPRLKHLGIYEYNPRYDRDGITARLASKLIHEFLAV